MSKNDLPCHCPEIHINTAPSALTTHQSHLINPYIKHNLLITRSAAHQQGISAHILKKDISVHPASGLAIATAYWLKTAQQSGVNRATVPNSTLSCRRWDIRWAPTKAAASPSTYLEPRLHITIPPTTTYTYLIMCRGGKRRKASSFSSSTLLRSITC